jgi:hypothetical protein
MHGGRQLFSPTIEVVLRHFYRHYPIAARCGLLLEGLRSLGFVLRMEHGEHEDLHGLGHRRVTPYVHGRCVYYYVFFQLGIG